MAENQIIKKYNFFTHKGIDLIKYKNKCSEVIAHTKGVVVEVNNNKKYGNYVKIKHDNGMSTLYAHLKDIKVSVNDYVQSRDALGFMGKFKNNVYLHFEVYNRHGFRINPTKFINKDLPNSF